VLFCSFVFKKLSELKSGKECDGFTLVSGADFRRDDRCFIGFFSEAFSIFSCVEEMNDLLEDCFGCHSKVLVHLV
jgi:hypothetical protein